MVLGKNWFYVIIYFLSIQLLNELSQSFHLTYNWLPFFFISLSILNSIWFAFYNSLSWSVATVSSLLRCSSTYVHGTIILNLKFPKLLLANLECNLFSKMLLYFHNLTWSLTSNLGSLSLFSPLKSKYVFALRSIGFIVIDIYYCIYQLHSLIYQYTHCFWNWSCIFVDFISLKF